MVAEQIDRLGHDAADELRRAHLSPLCSDLALKARHPPTVVVEWAARRP